ncbi:MAG TPA: hypothetical protein PLL10_10020, partial [Elusimicrobiales bacterium]|nr:hypothetical protein [Elusimicrobiales bacterium]
MKHITAFLKNRKAELMSLLVLCLFYILLELKFPFYFLQDDAFNCILPMLEHNFRTLVSGHIPFYNPHQYLGLPLLSLGQYGTLYPPAYLASGLSRLLLGHGFGAMDILMFFHLACGLLGFFSLVRALGLGSAAASFGGLAWAFNGCSVFLGSSWWAVGQATAFFPWLLRGMLSLSERRDW